MKIRFIPLILSIFFTALNLLLGFFSSVEQPYYIGEDVASGCIIFLNFWWLLFYSLKCLERKSKAGLKQIIILYLLIVTISAFFRFCERPYNAVKWKTELGPKNYAGIPSHLNGDMVANIINSKMLIRQPVEKVKEILGTDYYSMVYMQDSTMCYRYKNKNPYDGCDKLYIEIKNGYCVKADFNGCD